MALMDSIRRVNSTKTTSPKNDLIIEYQTKFETVIWVDAKQAKIVRTVVGLIQNGSIGSLDEALSLHWKMFNGQ